MDFNPDFAQLALTQGMSEGTYCRLTGRHRLRKTYGRNLGNVPVIAVDVGGTVEDTWSAKRSWFSTKGFDIGGIPLGRREIVERLGGNEDLYREMVSDVYSDVKIASHNLTDGCSEALCLLATRFRVILLTSRPADQYLITLDWLSSRGIGRLIDELVCVGPARSKLEWCRAMNASVIVDDDMRHLETIKLQENLRAIHFSRGAEPMISMGSGVLSVCTWPDVVTLVGGLMPTAERTESFGVQL
jgi:hypothetical protein